MPEVFLPLTFCYITFCYNIWHLFKSLNSPVCLHCLEGTDDPMHKFKISVVRLLNIVLGIVSSIYVIVNNYLKQRINWSIRPCCHIYKVSDAFSHPERFPTALLHEDQQYVVIRSSLFGSCSWSHLSCVLYFLQFFGHGFILLFSKYILFTKHVFFGFYLLYVFRDRFIVFS